MRTSDRHIKKDKIDEMILALFYLTTFENHGVVRTWKSYDWDALDRLYDRGYISDPKSKAKSVQLSKEGVKLSEELFKKIFCQKRIISCITKLFHPTAFCCSAICRF